MILDLKSEMTSDRTSDLELDIWFLAPVLKETVPASKPLKMSGLSTNGGGDGGGVGDDGDGDIGIGGGGSCGGRNGGFRQWK